VQLGIKPIAGQVYSLDQVQVWCSPPHLFPPNLWKLKGRVRFRVKITFSERNVVPGETKYDPGTRRNIRLSESKD